MLSAHADTTEKNLIVNGDFEQMENGVAAGWTVLKGASGSIASFPAEPGKGNIGRVDNTQNTQSAYLSQWVKLEPHQNYRLSLQAAMSSGKLTFAAGSTGLNKRMFGELTEELPMAPLFWDESWLASIPFEPGQWREASMEFNSGDVTKVLITLGGFFSKGSYLFDDVKLVKIP